MFTKKVKPKCLSSRLNCGEQFPLKKHRFRVRERCFFIGTQADQTFKDVKNSSAENKQYSVLFVVFLSTRKIFNRINKNLKTMKTSIKLLALFLLTSTGLFAAAPAKPTSPKAASIK